MMARLVEFEESRRERFREMDQVLTILGDQKIDYMVWKHSMSIHECLQLYKPFLKSIRHEYVPNWIDLYDLNCRRINMKVCNGRHIH
jgi:hypothetical protein